MWGRKNKIKKPDEIKLSDEKIIRVAIADDHAIFRTGIKTALQRKHKGIQVVAEAENGMQLLDLLRKIKIDVILLDIQMPIMDGITALPLIKKEYPDVKVIMLSFLNDPSVISKLMEIGANSYITKESGAELIYVAINEVFENTFYFNETIKSALLYGRRPKSITEPVDPQSIHLTDKETIILQLMFQAKSTAEIANIVDLSPRTVEAIRDKLKTKTGTKSMAGLIMFAVKRGLVSPEEDENEKIIEAISAISKEQMATLFKISTSILSYINHDLAGQRTTIYNSLDQIKEELQKDNKSNIDNQKIGNLIVRALDATQAVTSISGVIKSYVNVTRAKDQDSFARLFISWPKEIIKAIQERNNSIEINIGASPETLKIIYPNIILLSILSELTENARKNTKEHLKVIIKWNMKGNTFQCEFHDNGPGFKNLKEKQYAPMTSLELSRVGMGLKIIERTIIDSGGHLFFSKSEHLKGAKIFFEFPVLGFV